MRPPAAGRAIGFGGIEYASEGQQGDAGGIHDLSRQRITSQRGATFCPSREKITVAKWRCAREHAPRMKGLRNGAPIAGHIGREDATGKTDQPAFQRGVADAVSRVAERYGGAVGTERHAGHEFERREFPWAAATAGGIARRTGDRVAGAARRNAHGDARYGADCAKQYKQNRGANHVAALLHCKGDGAADWRDGVALISGPAFPFWLDKRMAAGCIILYVTQKFQMEIPPEMHRTCRCCKFGNPSEVARFDSPCGQQTDPPPIHQGDSR